MGDHEHSATASHKLVDEVEHKVGVVGVEVASRFVAQQDARVAEQRSRNGNALLLAAR